MALQLKDVVRHAGVSSGTASRVLSGRQGKIAFSEATRQRVLKAARDLNYRANAAAHERKDGFGKLHYIPASQAIYDPPNFGNDLPTFPYRILQVRDPGQLPISADSTFACYPGRAGDPCHPGELAYLLSGPFHPDPNYDPYGSAPTSFSNHYPGDGRPPVGMNVSFMDGSVRWRTRDEIGPRAMIMGSHDYGYGYVYWY